MASLLWSLWSYLPFRKEVPSQNNKISLIDYPYQENSPFTATTFGIRPSRVKKTPTQSKSTICNSSDALVQEKLQQLQKTHSLSSHGKKTNLRGIKASVVSDRKDLQHQVIFSNPARLFKTNHVLVRNSPFNGHQYQEDEAVKTVQNAITSPHYRYSKEIALLRRVETDSGEGLIYSGRPETPEKAEELIRFIVEEELSGKKQSKGLTKTDEVHHEMPVYDFHFVVTSLMSMLRCKALTGKEPGFARQERQTLQDLAEKKDLIEVNVHGKKILVRPHPIFLATQFNVLTDIEHILPDRLNGKSHADEIAKKGMQELEKFIKNTSKTRTEKENRKINFAISALKNNLSAAEKVFLQIYISDLLNLPIDIHCKSSVDRTAIAVGIAAALKQWKFSGKEIPLEDPQKILREESFKEFFAANVLSGLPISKYARNTYGLKWKSAGIYFPTLTQLLPRRLLKTDRQTIFKYFLIWLFSPLVVLALTLGNVHYEITQSKKSGIEKVKAIAKDLFFMVFRILSAYIKGAAGLWSLRNTKKIDETFGGQIPSNVNLIYQSSEKASIEK